MSFAQRQAEGVDRFESVRPGADAPEAARFPIYNLTPLRCTFAIVIGSAVGNDAATP
jgi:hypothetical protein